MANIGKIVQVIGPVLDVKFDSEKSLPNLLNALVIKQGERDSSRGCTTRWWRHC